MLTGAGIPVIAGMPDFKIVGALGQRIPAFQRRMNRAPSRLLPLCGIAI